MNTKQILKEMQDNTVMAATYFAGAQFIEHFAPDEYKPYASLLLSSTINPILKTLMYAGIGIKQELTGTEVNCDSKTVERSLLVLCLAANVTIQCTAVKGLEKAGKMLNSNLFCKLSEMTAKSIVNTNVTVAPPQPEVVSEPAVDTSAATEAVPAPTSN